MMASRSVDVGQPPAPRRKAANRPADWLVHLGLIVNQMAFGGGSVVGKLGISHFTPLIFALIREGVSGPLLCIMAYFFEGAKLDFRKHWWRFLITGACLFANQLLFIVGLGLSTSLQASIWQPSQPVFTATIAICIGWEKPGAFKLLGIALATAGAMFMVAYGETAGEIWSNSAASFCFFFNCLGTSLYVIFSKPLLKIYPPISVTGWSYIVASVMMALSSLYYVHDADAWHVPVDAWWALAYWVAFTSILAYVLMTWANQYADASIVSAYSTLQPLTAGVLQWIFLDKVPVSKDLGAIGIILGMLCVVYQQRRERVTKEVDSSPSGGSLPDVAGADEKRPLVHRA